MCFAVIVGLHCHQMMFKCSGLEYFLIGLKLGLHFHHSVSYRLKQWCGQFGSKYRSCNIWTLKCFILSYKSNATELSWFVYFEQMKNSRVLVVVTENLRKRSECLLQLLKWMLAETGDMSHKFFIDPRPVTLHTVFEKKYCFNTASRCRRDAVSYRRAQLSMPSNAELFTVFQRIV